MRSVASHEAAAWRLSRVGARSTMRTGARRRQRCAAAAEQLPQPLSPWSGCMTKRGRSTGSGGASEVSRISRAVRGNFAAPSREWSCVWRRVGARHKTTTKSRPNRARTNEGNAAAGGFIWERVAQRGREPVGDKDARLLQIMDGSHERRE